MVGVRVGFRVRVRAGIWVGSGLGLGLGFEGVATHRTRLSVAREALCHGALVRERKEGVYLRGEVSTG